MNNILIQFGITIILILMLCFTVFIFNIQTYQEFTTIVHNNYSLYTSKKPYYNMIYYTKKHFIEPDIPPPPEYN